MKKPLSILLSCLLILETIPSWSAAPELHEKSTKEEKAQDFAQQLFEGKKPSPLVRHSREGRNPVHPLKTASLDGRSIAQAAGPFGDHFGTDRLYGPVHRGHKADPPKIKEEKDEHKFPEIKTWCEEHPIECRERQEQEKEDKARDQKRFDAAFDKDWGTLGVVMAILTIPLVFPAIILISHLSRPSAGSAEFFNFYGKMWGYFFGTIGVATGGFISGLAHNLLLGQVDLKVKEPTSYWAGLFNASQEAGKWITFLGGLGAVGVGSASLAGAIILPQAASIAMVAAGGYLAGSKAVEGIQALVRYAKVKSSENERASEEEKTRALKQELKRSGITEAQIQKALSPHPYPTSSHYYGKQAWEQEREHNLDVAKYERERQEALKKLKEKEILRRNEEKQAETALRKSAHQVFTRNPLNLKDNAQKSKIEERWFNVIREDINDYPLPPLPPGHWTRFYPAKEGHYLKVRLSDLSGRIEILEMEPFHSQWESFQGRHVSSSLSQFLNSKDDPNFNSTLQDSAQKEILRQEQDLRTQTYGSTKRWGYSDNLAQFLIHNPKTEITLLYEAVYRNDDQGQPQIIHSQIFDAQNLFKGVTEALGNTNPLARSVPLAILFIEHQQQEPVYGDGDSYGDGDTRIKGYRTTYEIGTWVGEVSLDLRAKPPKQPKDAKAATKQQEDMEKTCRQAKEKSDTLKAKGQEPDADLAELLNKCAAAVAGTEGKEEVYEGMTVYRVWGGASPKSAKEDGRSWTPLDPRPAPRTPQEATYRFQAGLWPPPLNTGEWLTMGILKNKNGIDQIRPAIKGPNGGGGWPEILFKPNPVASGYIQILQSVPVNPPF